MTPGRSPSRRMGSRARVATRARLESELRELRDRLAEAEQTLHAIANDDVDALVVTTRERGRAQVLTIGRAQGPYEHLVDALHDGALTVDGAGVVLHASRGMLQLAHRDALVGESVFALFEDARALRTLLQNAGDEAISAATSLRRSDGTAVGVEVSAAALPLGEPRRVGMLVSSDGRRPAPRGPAPSDAGAEARTSRHERVLAQLPVGILIVDARSGHVSFANRQAEEILGGVLVGVDRSPSYLELTCWRDDGTIVEPEQLPVARVLRGEPLVREDLARPRPDGTFAQTRTTAVPLLDDDGELESVLVALEDRSREYTAKVERDSNERFRELFIGMLGHDLRDPLSAMGTGAALLQRRGGLTSEQATVVRRIASATDRMARMVDQILDFTRGRLGGGIPLRRQPVALPDVVRRAVASLDTGSDTARIQTVFDGQGTGEWDPDRLEQVVANLVSNALRHGRRGAPVLVRTSDDAGTARIVVHNEGPPSDALLPHIFDPFRRAAAHGGRGLGLGLYIAQLIVHAHGGTLTVDSSAERGTTFVVLLPRVVD